MRGGEHHSKKYHLSTLPTLLSVERISNDTDGQLDDIPEEWDDPRS